ncbi:uncharacterized protein LOC130723000 isoform X2 [Lotus japonicus]|nr:uncharacterized protein LOC130723000 isoform X2 [Lotus japonicus]
MMECWYQLRREYQLQQYVLPRVNMPDETKQISSYTSGGTFGVLDTNPLRLYHFYESRWCSFVTANTHSASANEVCEVERRTLILVEKEVILRESMNQHLHQANNHQLVPRNLFHRVRYLQATKNQLEVLLYRLFAYTLSHGCYSLG